MVSGPKFVNYVEGGTKKPLRKNGNATQDHIKTCWFVGIGLLLLGGFIIGGGLAEGASAIAYIWLGMAIAGAGQIVVLIAVIATGVRLGIQGATPGR